MKASVTSSQSGSRISGGASSAWRARNTELVFVYGTLRQGGSNARLMRRARYLGSFRTQAVYHFFDCGDWPGAMPGGNAAIAGEVYVITPPMLKRIDQLEDYPRLYRRVKITTTWGAAWMYLLCRRPANVQRLAGGDWLMND